MELVNRRKSLKSLNSYHDSKEACSLVIGLWLHLTLSFLSLSFLSLCFSLRSCEISGPAGNETRQKPFHPPESQSQSMVRGTTAKP